MLTSYDRGPGLYWRDETKQTRANQSTGVAGFLGYASPAAGVEVSTLLGTPHTLTHWEELEPLLGTAGPDPWLEAAVRGFFENGGRQCVVVLVKDAWSRLADTSEQLRLMGAGLDDGLAVLETVEEIDLVAAPFLVTLPIASTHRSELYELQKRLLKLCAVRGDCFAILDAPAGVVGVDLLKAQWSALSSHEGALNGALYYPWVKVPGRCSSCLGTGRTDTGACQTCDGSGAGSMPPCGHMAGIYARLDARVGVYRAPANEEIEGIVDFDHNLTGADHTALGDLGLNLLRAFPGRGLRVWGARTLSTAQEWRWISVRRLFLTVARWLECAMANVVFEPNDLALWIRIDRELTTYFEGLYRAGALKGRTASESFFVRCNEETNPLSVREQGLLVVEVGLAPTVPREYIVVRLIRGADGISMTS